MAMHNKNEVLFTEDHCAYGLMNSIEDEDGCWIYQKNKTSSGYAIFSYGGKEYKDRVFGIGHRIVYLWHKGAIPDGWDIDHICHNEAVSNGRCTGGYACKHRACINPEHLRAVPHSENIKAGSKMSYRNRTHCLSGHKLSKWARTYEKNDIRYKSGKATVSYCKLCNNESQRNTRRRKKMQNA